MICMVNRINKRDNIDSCFVVLGNAVREFIHLRYEQPHVEEAHEIRLPIQPNLLVRFGCIMISNVHVYRPMVMCILCCKHE